MKTNASIPGGVMKLDILSMLIPDSPFAECRIFEQSAVECAGVIRYVHGNTVILPDYIYVIGKDEKEVPEELVTRSDIAVCLPLSLKDSLFETQLSCDAAFYKEEKSSPAELTFKIAEMLKNEKRIQRFKLELSDLVMGGADLSTIINCARTMLGNPIVVMNPSGRLYLHTGLDEKLADQDPVLGDLLHDSVISPDVFAGCHMTALHNRIMQELEPFQYTGKGLLNRMIFRLMDRRSYLGYVMIIETERNFSMTDFECLKILASILTFRMADIAGTGDAGHQEDLLFNLLDGSIDSVDQLVMYESPGDDLTEGEFRLLVMELDAESSSIEDMNRNHLLISRQHFLDRFYFIRHVCIFERYIVALVKEEKVKELLPEISGFLKTYGLYGSLGNLMTGVLPMRCYYRQCVELLTFCKDDTGNADTRFAPFEKYYCQLLLEPARIRQQVQEAILPEWIRLVKYDEEHNTSLVETLFHYLLTGSITATAAKLFIHKNTLIYRMNKIREISGCDLDDMEERYRLYMSSILFSSLAPEEQN